MIDGLVADSHSQKSLLRANAKPFQPRVNGSIIQPGLLNTISHTLLPDDLKHIQPIIDTLPPELTSEQRRIATDILKCNEDVFSKHEFDLGLSDLWTMRIETGDARPVCQFLRSHARVHLDVINETLEKTEAAGLIEKAVSAWCSNLVIVAKPNGKARVTLDLRGLNEKSMKDRFPLPKISDCFDALGGNTTFCTFDMSSSYHQMVLDPRDRHKLLSLRERVVGNIELPHKDTVTQQQILVVKCR